jgi:cell division GTPase FtsZ
MKTEEIDSQLIGKESNLFLPKTDKEVLKYLQQYLSYINILNLKFVLSYEGVTFIGVGESKENNSASKAVEKALNNISKDYTHYTIEAVFIHFLIPPNYAIIEIVEAMEIIYTVAEDDAEIFWSKSSDLFAETNSVQVTLIFNTCTSIKKTKVLNSIHQKV